MIESLNLNFIIPELTLAIGAMFVLMLGVYTSNGKTASFLTTRVSAIILLAALGSILCLPTASTELFSGLYKSDDFALVIKAILIFSAAIVLIISFPFIADEKNKLGFEYPILVLLSLLGMIIMVSSNDLLTLYLGLELQSLSLYILAAIKREDKRATEAAVKYFVLGALASGILLYGISLVYGFLGTTNLTTMGEVLSGQAALSKGVIVGLVFIMVGFAFKISAAPFHMWTPDVYEGVPTPVTAYFAIVPKIATIALFIRLFAGGPFAAFEVQWQQVLVAIAVLSMVVGAFGAIWQSNIKRLLAYSSIGHVGYALLGLVANTEYGVQSVIAYFVIYILTSIAFFTILISLKSNKEMIENIDDFKGLASRHPIIALTLALLLFSMIGLPFPPYAGFFGKFFVFSALLEKEFYTLAVIGMAASVVAAYYYLRVIKVMYFDAPLENSRISLSLTKPNLFVLLTITALSFVIFIAPSTLMDPALAAAASLFGNK